MVYSFAYSRRTFTARLRNTYEELEPPELPMPDLPLETPPVLEPRPMTVPDPLELDGGLTEELESVELDVPGFPVELPDPEAPELP